MRAGFTLWMTGLPCSGKTTLAEALRDELKERGLSPCVLDGDALRRTLSPDLGYSPSDRRTHVRRVTEMARSLTESGNAVIAATISPYRSMREEAKRRIVPLIEVYVRCPLEICEDRDVKGMYQRARRGEIANFTGISSPYEEPQRPDLVVNTGWESVSSCVDRMADYLGERGLIARQGWLVDRKKRTG